ncbi:hypothetical protein Btru_025961 [Bulinus truncatus]|nr:hypothetical protein Btru_025961 [Bulinus truncatus]
MYRLMSLFKDSETSTMTTMRIILVGRDGNGKSSSVTSITKVKRQHRSIMAEKSNGVGDTREDLTISIETVEKNMETIMNSCSVLGGFNAIVFVLKYGVRFTQQEKDAVAAVRSMLGDDVFLNYGIIMMTYGDLFDMDHEDGCRSFMDWCKYQTGDIQSLFEEVNYRIVLFDNKTKDISKLDQQYDKLYDILSRMTMTYGIAQFKKAKFGRKSVTRKVETVKRYAAIDIPENITTTTDVLTNVAYCSRQLILTICWLMIFIALILAAVWIPYIRFWILTFTIVWIGFGILLYRLKMISTYTGELEEINVYKTHYGSWYSG